MSPTGKNRKRGWGERQQGFSLLEMMITLFIMLAVTSIVMTGMMQMTLQQGTIANRTELHGSVRDATEVLQQEIGQAGKIALPTGAAGGPTQMLTAITAAQITNPSTGYTGAVVLDGFAGVFNGMLLVVGTGDNEETVAVTNPVPATNTFTGTFYLPHAAHANIRVAGTFASGIIPPNPPNTTTSPSDGFTLKLYGDINDDGNLVYVVYKCDTTVNFQLTRSVTAFDAATIAADQVLLPNVHPNPGSAPCFKYQVKSVYPDNYVVDVSVTLTVQTQNQDPQTHQFQTETKALLNVAPRNIFEGWQLAGGGVANRIQPMPPTVGPGNGSAVGTYLTAQ